MADMVDRPPDDGLTDRYVCLRCRWGSNNPRDLEAGYCGVCRDHVGRPRPKCDR